MDLQTVLKGSFVCRDLPKRKWAEAVTQKRKLYFCHEIPSGNKVPTSSGCAIQLTFSREGVPCYF